MKQLINLLRSKIKGKENFSMPSPLITRRTTDEELVILALKERDYYGHLMRRYEAKLVRYIRRISGVRREDAEDILQDVFLKAFRNLNDFDSRLKFSSWIYRIAHNETVSHLRKMTIRRAVQLDAHPALAEMLRSDFDIEEAIDKKYLKRHLHKLIGALEERYRVVLILYYEEGKNYQEISDILKRPMSTVATLLRRAKEKLREQIINHYELFHAYVQHFTKNT